MTEGRMSVVTGRYRFHGIDRHAREVAYAAALTFVLRREDGGPWRIARMHESLLPQR